MGEQSTNISSTSPVNDRELWVLGCSATKLDVAGDLPALSLYDGPAFRVVRSFLRGHDWPSKLSIAVLSAKHRLIGALTPLENYNQRMTPMLAGAMRDGVTESLTTLGSQHKRLTFVLGEDYLEAIDRNRLDSSNVRSQVVRGPIGMHLNFLSEGLKKIGLGTKRRKRELPKLGRPLYLLPDWDDFLDVNFDFRRDRFSASIRDERVQKHSIELMRPQRLSDGVLVSLAQHMGSKGLLKRHGALTMETLAPRSVRKHFCLHDDQWAFGDCGAFSYVAEPVPSISVEKTVALYDLFDFDFGASVDHIPIPEVRNEQGKRRVLKRAEREERVRITRRNARKFIDEHAARRARFHPVGVIQGLEPSDYTDQLKQYRDFGYEHIALGGLVPRGDEDIVKIVSMVSSKLKRMAWQPWIHIFGVYRPNIHAQLRRMGINSFDSATYFRKSWLRSDQNYLGTDGKWYAAIRVPPTSDPRTMKRLKESGHTDVEVKSMERAALRALRSFDDGKRSAERALDAVIAYDALLSRNEASAEELRATYLTTLEARPWDHCSCAMCRSIGIDVLIFRGLNRNKRRGAHNTLQLYRNVDHSTAIHGNGDVT